MPAPDPQRFRGACRRLRPSVDDGVAIDVATCDAAAEAVAARLLAAWGASQRGYHDLEHLSEVLARLDELGCSRPEVELAAWFHDGVYTGAVDGADERASASWARAELTGLGLPDAAVQRVCELVLLTIDHVAPPHDEEAAALCDSDLAILAADPRRYDRYVAGVRDDFAHVPDQVFAAGRAAVLRTLLRRTGPDPGPDGPLFRSPGTRSWAAAAAHNLTRELTALAGGHEGTAPIRGRSG